MKKYCNSLWSTTNILNTVECITVFFSCLHIKSLLVTQFLKPDTQTPEQHTKSAKPYTNSQPLTQFSMSWNTFCKTQHTILYVTHKNPTWIDIMAKVFANVCFWDVFVIFWMQCFILQEMWGILHFVCAILGFVCKVLKMCITVETVINNSANANNASHSHSCNASHVIVNLHCIDENELHLHCSKDLWGKCA